MVITLWNTLKIKFNAFTQYHPGRLVSKGFWSLYLCALGIFVFFNVALALSWVVRFALNGRIGIAEWESFLAWPPMLLAMLFRLGYLCLSKSKESTLARAAFLEKTGDTLLSRAAYKESDLRPEVMSDSVFAALIMCGVVGPIVVLVPADPGQNGGIEYLCVFMTLALLLILGCMWVISSLVDAWGRFFPNTAPSALVARLFNVITFKKYSRRDLDEQFQALPSVEKQLLLTRAAQLGANPDSAVMKRAAVQDYHLRVAQAQKEATALSAATQAPLSKHASRPRL